MADTPLGAGPHGEPARVCMVDPTTGDPVGTGTIGGVVVNAGGAIGEIQASPTANTVLDRLKALLTGIVLAAGSAIIGKVGIDQTTPGTTNGVVPAGNVAAGATDSGNPLKVGGIYLTTPPVLTTGQRGDAQLDISSNLRARIVGSLGNASDALSNALISFVLNSAATTSTGALAIAPYKFNGTSWDRDRKPNTSSHIPSSAATTNATVLKASAGDLHTIVGFSARASICYLHIYNKATAPTVGTDVPVMTLPIPVSSTAPFSFDFKGLYFATGISYGFSTGSADNDSTAIAAGDVLGFCMTGA